MAYRKLLLFCYLLSFGCYVYSQNINYQFVEAESDLRIFFYDEQGKMYDKVDVYFGEQKLM